MTALNDAADALVSVLDGLARGVDADVANLFRSLHDGPWDAATKRRLIEALREHLPDMLLGYVGVVSDVTAEWYQDLAPDEEYTAEVPPDVVAAERISTSIGWAVSTATAAETAVSQLQGSVRRMLMDGQRVTVVHNAAAERVRYLRHCNYAACNFCLALATRGAAYASATSAVKGHDNCRCIAVPLRGGMTEYRHPPLVRDAEERYGEARRQIEAEGGSPTLQNIVRRMSRS
ncbi:hypothetical protein JRC04_22945 [Mycolicibacterium sp. S2-37]|uniref:VG15 protein n=1 Tax=Mycolicibacterium sp. S2-37 TaxID=2810297 RepID=UPI001A9480CC|nr:hypothetical protein [Mycolicibacterium sp. S2-37]MBO0680333.1 hypothetical protein [Mycolicibacterium sp. S2-37]